MQDRPLRQALPQPLWSIAVSSSDSQSSRESCSDLLELACERDARESCYEIHAIEAIELAFNV